MFAIGEAARKSGVSIETIRYYEREGIIHPIERTESGRRVFSEQDISVLRFIRRCRDLGFSIQDARSLLAFTKAPDTACHEVNEIATRQLQDVRAKIAELQKLESALVELVRNCAQGATKCQMLTALMSEPGAGPV